MKYLIVGLGNIGPEYAHTRHNMGFMVLDELAKQENAKFYNMRLANYTEVSHKGRMLYLIKPTTYMNLSGKAVRYGSYRWHLLAHETRARVSAICRSEEFLRVKSG